MSVGHFKHFPLAAKIVVCCCGVQGSRLADLRSRTEATWGITQTEKRKLQKGVNELKEQLQKMSTTSQQTDKESTRPDSNSRDTAKLLEEILATKELTQQEEASTTIIKAENELLL